MNIQQLAKTIDVAQHDFSLILVEPKQPLLDWLTSFAKRTGRDRYRLYYPEGNLALVIPRIDRFSEHGSFEQFLHQIKPKLLQAELTRFQATEEDFGHPLTGQTFDSFFDISVRESALLMSDFK